MVEEGMPSATAPLPSDSQALRALAGRLGASPYHLCRVFRRWSRGAIQTDLEALKTRKTETEGGR